MPNYQLNKIINIFVGLTIFHLSGYTQPHLPTGHSHNDYLQKRPLYEAIELGFGSIEIDICLTNKNKELKVAHIPWFLSGKKNIEELYFAPIAKMINEKDTLFKYTSDHPLHLLIDFKKSPDSTYKYLQRVFVKYGTYITQYKNGKVIYKAPLVINITGNKPWKAIMNDSVTYAKIDGPLRLNKSAPYGLNSIDSSYSKYMGRAAANYKQLLKFKKNFDDDEAFYKSVKENIESYHNAGITTRYYEVPNNKKSWEFIIKCGIKWVNVDKLKEFSNFYKEIK